MIKAVIFDFGGVVTNAGFEDWISEHVAPYETLKEEMMPFQKKVDRGDMSPDIYYEYLSGKTGIAPQEVRQGILDKYVLHKDTVNLVVRLHTKGIRTGLLTNFVKEWFSLFRQKFQLDNMFDTLVVSSEVRLIKPQREIFQLILEKLHIAPHESVFVDDKQENVVGARDVGMYGILFTDTPSLIHDLKQLGVQV